MSRHTTKAIRVYSDAIMRVFELISSLTKTNHTPPVIVTHPVKVT